jgi:hypothetical protein
MDDDRLERARAIWDIRDARREIRGLRWLVISQIVLLTAAVIAVVGVILSGN